MQETIILAPGANGQELLKSLALYGHNNFGVKIVGAPELARISLMRNGIALKGDLISGAEEVIFASEAMQGEPYFASATAADAEAVSYVIRRLRSLAGREEAKEIRETFSKGIFTEKNAAIVSIYEKYMALFSEVIDRLHEEYRKDSNIFDDRKFEMVEDESIDGAYVKVDRKTVKTALQAYKG